MQIYLSWCSKEFKAQLDAEKRSDHPEQLRILQQRLDLADDGWRGWCNQHGGSVLTTSEGAGSLQISAEHLDELPQQLERYRKSLSAAIHCGLGKKLSEADTAMQVALRRGDEEPVLYVSGIEKELVPDEPSILAKASGQSPPPPKPNVQSSPHSEGEALLSAVNDPERLPPPEATHAAEDLEEQLHGLAQKQTAKDSAEAVQKQDDTAKIRESVAAVLEKVRGQAHLLAQLKLEAPEAYQTLMALIQSVIAMGRALPQPLQKGETKLPHFRNRPLEPLDKADVPSAPKAPTSERHHVVLPPGSRHEGGPTGAADPHRVGKTKVKHGSGKSGWVQSRAGQIAATNDRHAAPILGHSSHPISSRNPNGH